jgi:polar amino acid transport system substrate-binding protein
MHIKHLVANCLFLSLSLFTAAHADSYENIKKKGTLTVGVFNSNPPFGIGDPKTNTVSGYDVDFAAAIAKHLGVRIEVKPVDPAERIPKLQSGEVDMIVAAMTKNAERQKLVDFSTGYFVTGQKFLVRKGKVGNIEDLTRAKIGTPGGSTSETQLRRELPNAQVVLFHDVSPAVDALGQLKIDAVSTDEPILAALLNKMPNKQNFEIPDVSISLEIYGIAVRKGEKHLLQEVNDTLLSLEASGQAERIFDRWFGTNSGAPMIRTFKIKAS